MFNHLSVIGVGLIGGSIARKAPKSSKEKMKTPTYRKLNQTKFRPHTVTTLHQGKKNQQENRNHTHHNNNPREL